MREPARLLRPLMDFLEDWHASGKAHGAIMPGRLLLSPTGQWDLGFFKSCAGSPDALEAEVYYPDGPGQSLADSQRRDVSALAAVLYLILADHPPARRGRRVQTLAGHPHAQAWPSGFVALIDQALTAGADEPLPPLADWKAALGLGAVEEMELPPSSSGPLASVMVPPVDPVEGAAVPELSGHPRPSAPVWPLPPSVRLPNAMVGRAFAAAVDLGGGADFSKGDGFECSAGLPPGLVFSDGMLSGSPTLAGDFEIRLRNRAAPSVGGMAAAGSRLLLLTVNANPQSLWKNLPSDPDGIFARPDAAASCLPEGPLTVMGASLRGRSHAHTGGYRDDDFSMAWLPQNPWYVLTVADGAGSARFSRQGAHRACGAVRACLEAELGGPPGKSLTELTRQFALQPDGAGHRPLLLELERLFAAAARQALTALETEAAGQAAALRDFHTTLITVLLHPLPDGGWFAAAFSIGDGAAAVVGAPGGVPCLLTHADSGDYAGQTVFLTMPEALSSPEAVRARIRTAVLPDFDAVLLVTDGISDPRFPSDTALADPAGWTALWQEIQPLLRGSGSAAAGAEKLLEWMSFHSPGHHDDRTIVLAARPLSLPAT